MSRNTRALLGFGVALLLAAPALGLLSVSATSVASAQNVPTTVVNGYNLIVMPPLSKVNDFYGGATLPVAFMLFDSSGNPVTTATATLWVNGAAATSSGMSNQGNMFKLAPSGLMYIYALNTKPYPAGPGSPTATITISIMIGSTTITQSYVMSFD